MSDQRRVPVTDKRRLTSGPSPAGDQSRPSPAGASGPAAAPLPGAPEADASSASRPSAPEASSATPHADAPGAAGASSESRPSAPDASSAAAGRADSESRPSAADASSAHDYLADLQRLQAEFDNYRKRTLKEQTAIVERASERLVGRLLPVLDNLENAIAHGEGGAGVELTHKEFVKALADEGLEEIEAEGRRFDPRVHDAFEMVEADDLSEPIVRRVLRKGYRLKDRVLRPAMVAVARPVDEIDEDEDDEARVEESEE